MDDSLTLNGVSTNSIVLVDRPVRAAGSLGNRRVRFLALSGSQLPPRDTSAIWLEADLRERRTDVATASLTADNEVLEQRSESAYGTKRMRLRSWSRSEARR
jgi:hypothetical protein